MTDNQRRYWRERWQTDETGWKAQAAEPDFFSRFHLVQQHLKGGALRALVPLCGDSPAVRFLYDQQFHVIAVDFAEQSLRLLQKKDFPEVVFDGSEQLQTKGLELVVSDFFSFKSDNQFDLIYDRAAFVAIDPALRADYVKRLFGCLREGGIIFLDVFSRDEVGGPPYSTTPEEVAELFGDFETLWSEAKQQKRPSGTIHRQWYILRK